MSLRCLFLVGAVWFVTAAAFVIYIAQTDFAIGWLVGGMVSNAASVATVYFLFTCTALLLTGWTIPVGIGMYRLLRR